MVLMVSVGGRLTQNSSDFCKLCLGNSRFPYMLSYRRYNSPAFLKCHYTPPLPLAPCFVYSNSGCRKVQFLLFNTTSFHY